MAIVVGELRIHPIKSARGIRVARATVGDRGFVNDRRFMVVDGAGRFLTQRELPRMALIEVALDGDGLRVAAPGMPPLALPLAVGDGPTREVQVWDDRVAARPVDAAGRWFADFLGRDAALVYMPDSSLRPTNPKHGPGRVSFADGYPFLLANTASRDELGRRGADVPMERFRPNIVVDGAAPFAEDRWKRARIGAVVFRFVKPCGRCSITTVDPARGEFAGPEPLRTLATFRKIGGEVAFAHNLIHEGRGEIAVGDPLVVEE